MRTVGELHLRSRATAQVAALVTLVCFALAGVWVVYGIDGYVVTSAINHTAPSNPLTKEVARQAGAWLVNFNNTPALWAIPALGAAAAADRADVSSGERRSGVRILFTDAGMHHPDGGDCDVPVRDAIQHHDERQPDHVGCNVQSVDAELNDLCCLRVRTDYPALHHRCYWKMFGRITKEHIESNTHSMY